jgi:hypothetical protein
LRVTATTRWRDRGTTGDKSAAALAEWTVPKAEIGAKGCVRRHTAFMAIRYNRWFRITAWARLMRVMATVRAPDRGQQ